MKGIFTSMLEARTGFGHAAAIVAACTALMFAMSGCQFLAGAAVGGATGYVVGHEAGEDDAEADHHRDDHDD